MIQLTKRQLASRAALVGADEAARRRWYEANSADFFDDDEAWAIRESMLVPIDLDLDDDDWTDHVDQSYVDEVAVGRALGGDRKVIAALTEGERREVLLRVRAKRDIELGLARVYDPQVSPPYESWFHIVAEGFRVKPESLDRMSRGEA